jgi:hypothetical protein
LTGAEAEATLPETPIDLTLEVRDGG